MNQKEGLFMIKKESIDETNIIRAIACLAVIMIHITASPITTLEKGSIHSMIFILINRSLRFATPTFIFLSGLTLFYSYEDRIFKYITFLKKRFSGTLIAYGIWSIVYFLFYYALRYPLSPKMFIKNMLLANMSYHLYFVLIITQFYIIFPMFLSVYKRFNSHIILILSLIGNLLFLKYVYIPYSDRFFMSYIFFFSYGCYVAKHIIFYKKLVEKLKYLFAIAFFSTAIYDSYLFYQYYIWKKPISNFLVNIIWILLTVFAIFFLTNIGMIINKIEGYINSILNTIAESSYYIYLSHPLVLSITNYFLIKIGIYSITGRAILNVIIVYGITLSLSIGYTKFKAKRKKKIPLHSY